MITFDLASNFGEFDSLIEVLYIVTSPEEKPTAACLFTIISNYLCPFR